MSTRNENVLPSYTISLPNGQNANSANLKHCTPIGIPTIVMQNIHPARHHASPPSRPPNKNQSMFPNVFICILSFSCASCEAKSDCTKNDIFHHTVLLNSWFFTHCLPRILFRHFTLFFPSPIHNQIFLKFHPGKRRNTVSIHLLTPLHAYTSSAISYQVLLFNDFEFFRIK